MNIIFDNTHFMRDPARDGSTNVPSDLEQIPSLLNFIKNNGTLYTNNHTPLISHTSDDIITTLTGVYPARHGVATAANSYQYYKSTGSTGFQSGFTYWTDTTPDGTYNLLSGAPSGTNPTGTNAPAPLVPFTRAGCSVGAFGAADIELENTSSDINTVFGAGSPQAQEATANPSLAAADFEGIAVHCAATDTDCQNASGAAPDVLPSEPGGYSGYNALFGNKYVAPYITNTPGNLRVNDTRGNQIQSSAGNPGFPGFSPGAAQALGYTAQMLEAGLPVTYAYIITPHRPIPSIEPGDSGDYGLGQAHYVAQLQAYDQAFSAFFGRLQGDGITPNNTLFVFNSDEGDHVVAGNPTNPGCDGVTTPCIYSPPPSIHAVSELNVDFRGLMKAEQGITTGASLTNDDAPDIYLTNNPAPTDPATRAYEQASGKLTVTNPLQDTYGNVGDTDTLAQAMANPQEQQILHMITFDPNRTPTFTAFANPDYYVTTGSITSACATSSTPPTACVTQPGGFAWNHGDVQPQITTIWLGMVGPGVANGGQDDTTWVDHTDIRATELALAGLSDDYAPDGRLLTEHTTSAYLPTQVASDTADFQNLTQVYKRINAPVGQLGLATLACSTTAMESGSATDDSTYTNIESNLSSIASQQQGLASQMSAVLTGATFNGTAIDSTNAQSLISQGDALLAQANSLVSQYGCAASQISSTPTPTTGPSATITATVTAILTVTTTATVTNTPVSTGSCLATAINAGGSAVSPFVDDADFNGGTPYSSTAAVDTGAVSNPAPQAVYQTVRYGQSFSYSVPGLTSGTPYTVRLHFNELYWGTAMAGGGAGSRVFNVAINGMPVLTNFDIYQTAGGANKALIESFPATADSNGTMSIGFTTDVDNAAVSGVEIDTSCQTATPTLTATATSTATNTTVPPTSTPTSTPIPSNYTWIVTDTGDSAADPNSLRYALTHAVSGNTITFALPSGSQTISVGSTLPVAANVAINGPTSTRLSIDGGGAAEVLSVNSGVTASISNLTISGGQSTYGGGIENDGTLTLVGDTLTNNAATSQGGAIDNYGSSAHLTLVNSTLVGNSSGSYGGGLEDSGGATAT